MSRLTLYGAFERAFTLKIRMNTGACVRHRVSDAFAFTDAVLAEGRRRACRTGRATTRVALPQRSPLATTYSNTLTPTTAKTSFFCSVYLYCRGSSALIGNHAAPASRTRPRAHVMLGLEAFSGGVLPTDRCGTVDVVVTRTLASTASPSDSHHGRCLLSKSKARRARSTRARLPCRRVLRRVRPLCAIAIRESRSTYPGTRC